MKKSGLVFISAGLLFIALTSCNKPEQTVVEKTITIQLDENEEYSFTLPSTIKPNAYFFELQASHYNISMIDQGPEGEQLYHYLPALDYRGTDQVIISDVQSKGEKPQCGFGFGNGNGPCGQTEEDQHRIKINFMVGGADAGVETVSR